VAKQQDIDRWRALAREYRTTADRLPESRHKEQMASDAEHYARLLQAALDEEAAWQVIHKSRNPDPET
jgi:hypothetical protein